MVAEFQKFLTQSNALALAIGVIIGAATQKMVSAVVNDLLMPVIALVLPAGDWRQAQYILSSSRDAKGQITVNAIKYGDLFGSAVDFIIVALMVFLIAKGLLNPAKTLNTKSCPECLETIPEAAKRCRACGVALQ